MEWLSRQLVLHGSLVLLLGFVGGFFFARAIKRGEGEVAWRVVHSGSSMGGILLIALGPVLPQLAVSAWAAQLVTWSLIVGVDVFVLAMVWAAVSGSRGLSRGGTLNNRIVNALYAVATGLTLIGCSSLVYCAARSAFDHESEAGEVSVHRLDQLGAALSRECFGAVRCAQCP